jgi:hypothetical protein
MLSLSGVDGIRCEATSPTIETSSIKNNYIGVTGLYGGHPFLGDTDNPGHNCIENSTSYHIVNLSPPDPIYAEQNYWGKRHGVVVCCPKNKFSGYVICSIYDQSPACGGPLAVSPEIYSFEDEPDRRFPAAFDLHPAFPNPFNPVTIIPYQVPPPGAHVKISIYDVSGRKVIDLIDRYKSAGYYDIVWNGSDSRGNSVASGVYFVQMRASGFKKTIKLVVIK